MVSFNRNFAPTLLAASIAVCFTALISIAQISNPGVPASGSPANNDCAKFVVSGGNVQSITTAGGACATGAIPTGANPTATAGPAAVNGAATTFMRSDAAPAVQVATGAQEGIVQGDAATLAISAGIISIALNHANTWTAVQSFTSGDLALNGATSGTLTVNCAAVCGTNTATFPGATDTVAELGQANAFTGNNSFAGTSKFTGAPFAVAANGTGTIGASAAGGAIVEGQGSTNDYTLENKNGTSVCTVATGTTTLNCVAVQNNGTQVTTNIASGTLALSTTAIASATCTAAQTATATGTATTDVVTASFNGDPTAVTGYAPSTSGMLTIIPYPTANTFNVKVCNNTANSITPGAITLNWKVVR